MEQKYLDQLKTGCHQLGLDITDVQYVLLSNYVDLLIKWNKVYNLTAIRELDGILSKHILDSLSIIKYIESSNIIDIGTGAGLPGIIIAILKPEFEVTLLDSNSKKTAFLQQAVIQLQLGNVKVINQRVEDYQPDKKFHIIISRAFAAVTDFVSMTQHLLETDGMLLAMKGKLLPDELDNFNNLTNYKVLKSIKLNVPFLDEDRHLLEIKKDNKY